MSEFKKIDLEELEATWDFKASDNFLASFQAKDLRFLEIDSPKRDSLIVEFMKSLDSDLQVAGEHREEVWEKGWGENLTEFIDSENLETLTPKYFAKFPEIRWKQRWITPANQRMELDLFDLLLRCIFEKHLVTVSDIYEFGCGTGHNLLKMRQINADANITGLDWARSSQEIIQKVSSQTKDSKLFSAHFDYFKPDFSFSLSPKSSVITIASLEQTGKKFTDFIGYLLMNRPDLVIHIEPIGEALDENVLLDNLSLRYFRKRNYLDGLVTHIESLVAEGKAEILDYYRSHVGSFFIEGYTVLIWRPL